MEIKHFITQFVVQFEESEIENINSETNFKQLETWDSLTAFSVQAMIEDEYFVKVSNDEIKLCNTVTDLFNLVMSKKS